MEPTPLPVPLKERVELASSEWLAAARTYLEPRVATNAGRLRGTQLTVCEVYTNPPPHLGYGDQVAFHIRVDDGVLTVGPGEVDDVDMKVRADYNQASIAVTAVWEQVPKRRARVLRELKHRAGGDVFEVKGGLDPASPVTEVLSGLHDHMARRTITNPDLAHRATHLGLDRRLDDLSEQGYTVLENAFSNDLADELGDELSRLIGQGPKPNLTAAMLLARGEIFEEVAVHPWVLTLAEHLVGRGCTLGQSLAFRKAKGIDTHHLHSDYALIPEPYPPHCLNVTTVWALEDFTETSGPTVVVPRSFKHNRFPTAGSAEDAVKVIMPKGSVALWHGATWHGAAVRDDQGDRLTLHNTYLRLYARTFDCYLDIDPAVLERNPPAVTTLCGLDDMFEKNSFNGTDRERLNYARANYSATGF